MLFNQIIALAGDLPGFDNGLIDYVKEQGGLAIMIVSIVMVIFFLLKQSFGKLFGTVLIGAFLFLVAGRPEHTFEQIGAIFEKFLG